VGWGMGILKTILCQNNAFPSKIFTGLKMHPVNKGGLKSATVLDHFGVP